jgi:hypothetical protein
MVTWRDGGDEEEDTADACGRQPESGDSNPADTLG